MKNKIIISALLLAFTLVIQSTFGQPPPPPPPPPGVPFGAVEILIAGLGAYAVKKFRNTKEIK